jgi:hypothetical protein
MEPILVWESWTPRWASPNVSAKYTPRTHDMGEPQPQRSLCNCNSGGAKWQGECISGMPKIHIQRFAMVHLNCKGGGK